MTGRAMFQVTSMPEGSRWNPGVRFRQTGAPSGVLIGPTPRQVISVCPGLAAVKAPMLTVCPLKVRSVLTLSAEIE
jgi:hypothetical protein